MNVSPSTVVSDDSTRPQTPPPSVADLARDLNRQTLHLQPDNSHCHMFPCDPATHTHTHTHTRPDERPTYSRIASASLRLQRQTNTSRHCNPSHLEDMSRLVARMVDDEDQCNVCEPKTPIQSPPSPRNEEDEGIDMGYASPNPEARHTFPFSFRRAADRVSKSAAVVKKVRMRRRPKTAKK